jgi:hypothetical protein
MVWAENGRFPNSTHPQQADIILAWFLLHMLGSHALL